MEIKVYAYGGDQEAPYEQLRVQLAQQNKVSFDIQKEKEVYFDCWHELVDRNKELTSMVVLNEGPILEMPQWFEKLFQGKLTKKVGKLKDLFKTCLELIKEKNFVWKITSLVEEPQTNGWPKKKFNHNGKRLKKSRELRMNS